MKHKNAEMIKSVVDNVDLVIFVRVIDQEDECGNYWSVSSLVTLAVASNDFFLCLPQHKEACLHWLSGGELQINRKGNGYLDWDRPSRDWAKEVSFMFDINEFRIKPKKEKRWIIWNENQDSYHCTFLVDPSDKYEANFKYSIHEIEVEV